MAEKQAKKETVKYTKSVLMGSKDIKYNKDVLEVLLEDNKEYTKDEVDKIVNDFNNKVVK